MAIKYKFLSYPLSEKTPAYGGGKSLGIIPKKRIAQGDSCNTFELSMLNHLGTHIDAPNHFWKSGRPIAKYSIEELVFKNPLVVECPKEACGIIEVNDLRRTINKKNVDLLIIKTGFQRHRNSNPSLYSFKNPCLSPDAAAWLRGNYPGIRGIAVDCISIASCAHRETGRQTHKILLRENKGKAVLIVEDIFIPPGNAKMKEVIVAPLFIQGIDSSPCSVIGVYR